MASDRYYAFCVYAGDFERHARGFVLAPNKNVALEKAKKRVAVERRRFAKTIGMRVGDLAALARTYRVRVWLDIDLTNAPQGGTKFYLEKRSTI